MGYLNRDQLIAMGFKSLGENVKISNMASIYDCHEISIGENSRIDDFCVISGKVEIGRNVHITPLCLLAGGSLGIKMCDFSAISYRGIVFTQSDDYMGGYLTNPTIPAAYRKDLKKKVEIGRHCIIGAGSIILPGVHLGEGCSIGAMSLVRLSTEPWGIYAGNPLKRVADRRKNLLLLEKKYCENAAKFFGDRRT